MPRWLKILIGTITSLVVLSVAAGFIFYHMLRTSLPEYSGEIKSDKISNEIKIYRDSLAIPYIIASTNEDASFALGYVHAQERLFTMDIARRAAEGRLSEIFGKETVPFDKMFRTVGIKKISETILYKTNLNSVKILNAYAAGVNKYLEDAKGKFPVEFDVLGYQPEKWKPVNSIEIIRMMGWELNISWWVDVSFTKLVQKFGEEKVKEILPDYPENGPTIIPPEIKNYPKLSFDFIDTDKQFRRFIGASGTHIGSNSWVVNGKMSESGKPIIANDTHLGFSAPGKWFTAVLRTKDSEVSGFTLPGVPGVVIGKNKNISWTMTNVMADDADFYLEKIELRSGNAEKPNGKTGLKKSKYFYNGEWKDLKVESDIIRVKNETDVPFKILSTVHGPVISDIHPFALLYPGNKNLPAITMKWMGNEFSDELTAILGINSAKDWSEFKNSLKDFSVPGQNFIYADAQGNIGYVMGAKIPIRNWANSTFVLDGTTDKYDWKGYVPYSEIPTLLNPSQNYLASANNKALSNFKYYISNLWEPTSRIDRITQLLGKKEKHSVKDYMNYQQDFVSPYANEITKFILEAFKNVKVTDDNLKNSLFLFEKWNFEMDEFNQVPTIYAEFLKYLLINIYEDEMGDDLFNQFVFVANVPYRSLLKVLNEPGNAWFDNVKTSVKENENDIIRQSLGDALTELENKFGKQIENWQWGYQHKVTFKHIFSGKSSLVDNVIDIGPYNIGGDGTTLFNTEYPFYKSIEKYQRFRHDEFENILGPAMRFVYDFSKPDEFYMILTTGESGNIMSKHYSDMTKMWLRGGYVKVRTDEKSITDANNKLLKIIRGE